MLDINITDEAFLPKPQELKPLESGFSKERTIMLAVFIPVICLIIIVIIGSCLWNRYGQHKDKHAAEIQGVDGTGELEKTKIIDDEVSQSQIKVDLGGKDTEGKVMEIGD